MSSRFLIPAALVAATLLVAACSSSVDAPEGFTVHEGSGTAFAYPEGLEDGPDQNADFRVGAESEVVVSIRRLDQPGMSLQFLTRLGEGVITNSGISDFETSAIDVPGASEANLSEGSTQTVHTAVISAVAGDIGYEFIVSAVDGALSEEQIATIIDSFEVTE